jgi:hypothetical protein
VSPRSQICILQPPGINPSLASLEFIRQTSVDLVGLYWDSDFILKSVWSWIDVAWLGLQSVASAVGDPLASDLASTPFPKVTPLD